MDAIASGNARIKPESITETANSMVTIIFVMFIIIAFMITKKQKVKKKSYALLKGVASRTPYLELYIKEYRARELYFSAPFFERNSASAPSSTLWPTLNSTICLPEK